LAFEESGRSPIAKMADDDIQPKSHPSLNLDTSKSNSVEVHIINTTTDIVVPAKAFVQPVQKGHETMNMPTFSFLIEHKKLGKTILFDLGCRKDWWNLSPVAAASIKNGVPGLNVKKDLSEILKDGGFDISRVNGIVWSHWHWDHTGNPSLFPKSADVIVGPGFKKAFLPAYPAGKESPVLESDFEYAPVYFEVIFIHSPNTILSVLDLSLPFCSHFSFEIRMIC